MAIVNTALLKRFEPLAQLSDGRRKELANLCFIETVNQDIDPLRMNLMQSAQALYLVKGSLGIRLKDGSKIMLQGASVQAKQPFNYIANLQDTIAITEVEILRLDADLLDIMMTWDQLSGVQSKDANLTTKMSDKKLSDTTQKHARTAGEWMNDTDVFSAFNLQSGVFSRLPPANVQAMFKRMESIQVRAGQVIIHQGAEGDYYYLIQSGTAVVTRMVDAAKPPVTLASLEEGSAFGEEALVSDNKRNATVTMQTDGELLRLKKQDFVALLKAPLIQQIDMQSALQKVQGGAFWLDVRLPSEYQYDHIQNASNVPLNEIRTLATHLDKSKHYIVYCQTGRRSMAGAFLLAELGFNVEVLAGGMRAKI